MELRFPNYEYWGGGLNIKCGKILNYVVVGKLIWVLITHKEVLWVKWVDGIYLKMMNI